MVVGNAWFQLLAVWAAEAATVSQLQPNNQIICTSELLLVRLHKRFAEESEPFAILLPSRVSDVGWHARRAAPLPLRPPK